jgi:TPP-dependent pyruvate/acetoin dehydrogenase alpha subunit
MTSVTDRHARAADAKRPVGRRVHREFGLRDAEAVDLYYAMLVTRKVSQAALKLAFQGTIDVSIPSD